MTGFLKGHALVVGVGDYAQKEWSVPVTVGDADELAATLVDPATAGYRPAHVRRLSGAAASAEAVLGALGDLARTATRDDTVVVFLCGHGALGTDGSYYFGTHETRFTDDNTIVAGTGIAETDLLTALRAVPAGKVLLILNACFAGHVRARLGAPAQRLGAAPSDTFAERILATGEGRALITASRASQYSTYALGAKTTIFGGALVDGLRGASMRAGSATIGLFDLYEYLYPTVASAAKLLNEVQEPVLNISDGVGPFPLALVPRDATALGTPSSPRTPTPRPNVVPRDRLAALSAAADEGVVEERNDQLRRAHHSPIVDFGNANIGTLTMGDVAGRDIVKVTVSGARAANAKSLGELAALARSAAREVGALATATHEERDAVRLPLLDAAEAATTDNVAEFRDRLEAAEQALLRMTKPSREALRISSSIGAIGQRAAAFTTIL